jgi:hypothetical protein
VTIDPGVGAVSAVGNTSVSPVTTTNYILMATNVYGWYSLTITVPVTGAPPPGPDATPPTVPVLLSPSNGATLPQPSSPWNFDWAASSDPESGINQYQLYVIHTGAANPVIDVYVATSFYSKTVGGSITAANLTNWRWKVRAQNNVGLWSAWSAERTFNVQAPPPGPDATPPTVPVLLSPSNGATLPQPSSPWNFDWAASSDPESGINQYQLYVIHTGAANPVIDVYVATSFYSKTVGGSITAANLTNWRWKVRAQNNVGLWSAWSAERTFNVQAP